MKLEILKDRHGSLAVYLDDTRIAGPSDMGIMHPVFVVEVDPKDIKKIIDER